MRFLRRYIARTSNNSGYWNDCVICHVSICYSCGDGNAKVISLSKETVHIFLSSLVLHRKKKRFVCDDSSMGEPARYYVVYENRCTEIWYFIGKYRVHLENGLLKVEP